eukprot:GFYU01007328.1.p1 GENE.GFYU01007328.1~~GFYU01007328.1.p1  ORF type:complete len:521 (+),score=244.80 GFYU01007328.1:199-1761(+)
MSVRIGTASSRASSQGSQASRRSRNSYRAVSRHSSVDESLFGDNTKKSVGRSREKPQIETIRNTPQRTTVVPDTDAVIISKDELLRLKNAAVLRTAEQEEADKKKMEAEMEVARRESKARKERMLKMEEERKKQQKLSDLDLEKQQADLSQRSQAEYLLDEQLDLVKEMNQKMLYAKCVTIRDAQLSEKRDIDKEKMEEEKRLDLIMEIERQKAIQMYQEREVKKLHDRKKGATILRQQIEGIQRRRLIELEEKAQEGEKMLKRITEMKIEEEEKEKARRERGKSLLAEVLEANQEQLRRKALAKEEEVQEDMRIAAYIADKERREMEFNAEQERKAAEKEAEVARLRAQQEKAQDKQAELDALRAKRQMEAYEREWREKERSAAEKQMKDQAELKKAREAQAEEKKRKLAEQAGEEREEFERIVRVQMMQENQEKTKESKQMDARRNLSKEIRNQIEEKEESRRQKHQEYLEEGQKFRIQNRAQQAKLTEIRHRKVQELEESGVPAKYLTELRGMKIST